MSCEHSRTWILTTNKLVQNKMIRVIPSSVATLFVLTIFWTVPNNAVVSATSNNGGVTRHYQFDVTRINVTPHYSLVVFLISAECFLLLITCACR